MASLLRILTCVADPNNTRKRIRLNIIKTQVFGKFRDCDSISMSM